MKTFIAGGGLGDCILILNKLRQLGSPQDKLIYYLAEKQANSRGVIQEFWESQGVNHEIRLVPETSTPLNHYDRAVCRKLNPLIYGMGFVLVEKKPLRWVFYPFDAFATPYMEFTADPPRYQRYFVVQSDAGTMKYRSHKNWLNTGWIDDFISRVRATGLKCILVGTKDVGIKGADQALFNLPVKDLLGTIRGAEFVLGLQGFVTIIALSMRKRVLLKRENFRVIFNYFHPRWCRHAKIFREPRTWTAARTESLIKWALKT